jgi:hypothetical protein
LAVVNAVVGVWVGSHFLGVGEIVDIVVAAAPSSVIGMPVFDGIEELFSFATLALKAQGDADLDRSAVHFAEGVSILGGQAVLAVLFRSVSRAGRGRRINPAAPLEIVNGNASPALSRASRDESISQGSNSLWGQMIVSRYGPREDRRQAALHENVQRMLALKVNPLHTIRIGGRMSPNARSPLAMYLEESLMETTAQVGVYGMRSVFFGLSFPVRNGYVTLLRKEGGNQREAHPALPELAGVVAGAFTVGNDAFEVRFSARRLPANRDPIPWGS